MELFIGSFPLELREPLRRRDGRIVGVRGVEDTRRTGPTEPTKQGSPGLTETETATSVYTGLH